MMPGRRGLATAALALLACAAVALSACESQDEPTTQPAPASSATPTPFASPGPLEAPPTASPTPSRIPAPPEPAHTAPVDIGETLTFATAASPPKLNIYDLARRLLPGVNHTPPPPPEYDDVGDIRTFNALNLDNLSHIVVSAELCVVTAHGDFYVETGLGIPCSAFEGAAGRFEDVVFPSVMAAFAPTFVQRNEMRIALLHADIPGAGGYYDSGGLYPMSIRSDSNERAMLFLNAKGTNVAGNPLHAGYESLVAHELQHAIHDLADPHETSWINEGLSVLAGAAFADGREFLYFLLACGPTQLMAWPVGAESAQCNYAGAGLFMRYLRHNYPDAGGTLRGLVADTNSSVHGISSYLRGASYSADALSVLADWGVANYLNARSDSNAYPDLRLAAPATSSLPDVGSFRDQFVQFAPHYVSLDIGQGIHRIDFQGETLTPLTKVWENGEGAFWHSGGADSADATLSRSFDLRGVDPRDATLNLLLRYETEEDWDFLYVLVSADKGETWLFMESSGMTGVPGVAPAFAFGRGFTGLSGGGAYPEWVIEEFDLGDMAGQKALIRLEYVTDQGVNLDGVSLGGAWLPAADYAWLAFDVAGLRGLPEGSASPDPRGGWNSQGFFFSNNLVEQGYVARLMTVSHSGEATVTPIQLDDSRHGSILFDNTAGDVREAAVMIFPMAPLTRQPASGTLTISVE